MQAVRKSNVLIVKFFKMLGSTSPLLGNDSKR